MQSNYRVKKKKIIWSVSAIVVITVVALNWSNWFGDLLEPAYRLPSGVQRVMVMPGEDGLRSRSMTWVSGEPAEYTVSFWADSTRFKVPAEMASVKTHGGQTYVYRVHLPEMPVGRYAYSIEDSSGSASYSDSLVISDHTDEQDFILIGDLQDWGAEDSAPFIQNVYDRYPGMDAWLFIGDQLERPHERFWNVYYETVRPLASSTPIIAIAGNHEYEWGLPFVLGPRWSKAMQYPHNGPRGQLGKSFYIDYPNVRIVCMDTNILYAHLFSVQKWLRRVLTERDDDPFLLVMGHHGVYSVRSGRLNMLMRYAIRPILEETGADLVIAGHDHSYARDGELPEPGRERQFPVYLTAASSHKCYAIGDSAKHVVCYSDDRFYQHIRITVDSLYLDSYRKDNSLIDTFVIGK